MNSWNGKPYHSLDFHLKEMFGRKVYKLALDGGMTCPNRDGSVGRGGCIFCSQGGSGDFAAKKQLSLREQADLAKKLVEKKAGPDALYIAYFQSYTNTYAPVERLKALFEPVITRPDIAALSIATRPDCLPEAVLDLLSALNQIKPVWVELGLQTIHPNTAAYIRKVVKRIACNGDGVGNQPQYELCRKQQQIADNCNPAAEHTIPLPHLR